MTRSAVLLLGRRVLRSTTTWAPCVVVGVVVLVFTTLFVVMSGFALSGPQVADREVGRADRAVMVGVVPGEALGTSETAGEVRAGMLAAGATDAWPTLLSFDVRPDVLPRAMTTGPSRLIRYVEGERLDDLFPAVRRLEDGRWPQSPGEVAVSSGLRERLVAAGGLDGDEIEVFSGLVTLRVTGTFVDEYDQAGSSLVGAPGTWGAMPGDEIAQRFAGVAAMFRLYWTGDPSDGDVAAVLQEHLAPESSPAAELVAEGLRRTDLERSPDFSLTDTTGFIFTFPMLASLVAAAAVAGRLAMVRSLALVTTTTRVGLRRRRVATMLLGVAVTCGLVATAVGAVLGAALGAALRWAVVPWLTNQPVGPFRDVLPIAAAAVLAVLVVVPLASVRLFTAADVTSRVAGLAGLVPWTFLRRLLAVVLVVRVAGSVRSEGEQAAAADLLVAQALVAALLLVPDLLRGAVAAIPTRRSTGLLVRRFMQAERARFAVMGILVALSLAAPTAVSTYVATTTRTEAAGNMAQVPQGQLWIDRSQGQPAASASAVVAEETGLQPVALEFTAAYTEGDLDSATPTAGSILALRSREDLETLMGRDVSAASLETLADGGVVLITGERHGRSVLVQEGAAPPTALDVPVSYQPGAPPELQQVAAGLVLAASAQELGIPRTPRLDVYVGLDDTEIRAAVAAVADGGRDTHAIQFHVVPEPTRATRDWYTAAVGLLSSCVLVLGAMMAGHGRQLREHGDRLVAIGIGRRTTFRVALVELALLILTAGLVAVVATVAALAVLAAAVQRQLLLDVPWTFVGFTVASTVAGCVLVLAGALRRGPAQVPRSSRRRILPVTVFGSSSSTTT